MSRSALKEVVTDFLREENPHVLCITGRWGVGKTFAWRDFLASEAKEHGRGRQYSYISLFGLGSLAALKFAIYENARRIDVPDENASKFERGKADTYKWVRGLTGLSVKGFGALRGSDMGDLLAEASFSFVRGQIICIDDLERSGRDLDLVDVLGLASYLRDERKCWVVFLMNEDELGEDEAAFRRHLEKVIDTRVAFTPSPDESAAVALSGPNEMVRDVLTDFVKQADVTNIRLIEKLARMARKVDSALNDRRDEIRAEAIRTVGLLGWIQLDTEHAPSWSTTTDFGRYANLFGNSNLDEKQRSDIGILRSLGFGGLDELGKVVANGVASGHFDIEGLKTEAKKKEELISKAGPNNSYTAAWSRFHDSLSEDDETLALGIKDSTIENIAFITPMNVNNTVLFLRGNGYEHFADEVADRFFEARKDDKSLLDRGDLIWMGDAPDPKMEAGLEAIREGFRDERDPSAVLRAMAEKGSWSAADTALIMKQETEFFRSLFLQAEGPILRKIIELCVALTRGNGLGVTLMKPRLLEALRSIARMSKMREVRVRRYIDELAPPQDDEPTE